MVIPKNTWNKYCKYTRWFLTETWREKKKKKEERCANKGLEDERKCSDPCQSMFISQVTETQQEGQSIN